METGHAEVAASCHKAVVAAVAMKTMAAVAL
jgi:hypothetical protein